ncbi:hypothetical protein SDJN02_10046, partial [Cucurbita argyrosperma subsp. argyrosperma]
MVEYATIDREWMCVWNGEDYFIDTCNCQGSGEFEIRSYVHEHLETYSFELTLGDSQQTEPPSTLVSSYVFDNRMASMRTRQYMYPLYRKRPEAGYRPNQSGKQEGMHFPPWRKAEYMLAKWLSSPIRTADSVTNSPPEAEPEVILPQIHNDPLVTDTDCGEFDESSPSESVTGDPVSPSSTSISSDKKLPAGTASPWQPPAVKPKSIDKGAKIVTGLASLLKEKS